MLNYIRDLFACFLSTLQRCAGTLMDFDLLDKFIYDLGLGYCVLTLSLELSDHVNDHEGELLIFFVGDFNLFGIGWL